MEKMEDRTFPTFQVQKDNKKIGCWISCWPCRPLPFATRHCSTSARSTGTPENTFSCEFQKFISQVSPKNIQKHIQTFKIGLQNLSFVIPQQNKTVHVHDSWTNCSTRPGLTLQERRLALTLLSQQVMQSHVGLWLAAHLGGLSHVDGGFSRTILCESRLHVLLSWVVELIWMVDLYLLLRFCADLEANIYSLLGSNVAFLCRGLVLQRPGLPTNSLLVFKKFCNEASKACELPFVTILSAILFAETWAIPKLVIGKVEPNCLLHDSRSRPCGGQPEHPHCGHGPSCATRCVVRSGGSLTMSGSPKATKAVQQMVRLTFFPWLCYGNPSWKMVIFWFAHLCSIA